MTEAVERLPAAMRLRYAGKCRNCAQALPAGTMAVYDRSSKFVTCTSCIAGEGEATTTPLSDCTQDNSSISSVAEPESREPEIFTGVAGSSARREGERRSDKREARIREAHPKLGGLILALSDDPQSTKAWEVGAVGEERLGRRLDGLKSDSVHVLHDRRISRSKANIDHMVVCPSGVFVIDAKKYKGRPSLRVDGGILRARTETLMVGSRNCTKLVGGVQWQIESVAAAFEDSELHDVPVTGMLCFVDAEWPLLGGSFTTSGITVLWPGKAAKLIRKPGPIDAASTQHIFRALATLFPAA